MDPSIRPLSWKHQQGLSLVEILVALTLGLILTAGVLQMYLSNKQSYRLEEAYARLQENGRFALEKISRDIREAGYWGCGSRTVSMTNTLNVLGDYRQYFYDFVNRAVQGFEWGGAGWTPAVDTNVFSSPLNGSDIITVRGPIDSTMRVVTPYMSNSSDDPHIGANNGLNQYDTIMITDCVNAAIMQITEPTPDTSGLLKHATGLGTPGNVTMDLGAVYRDNAEVFKIGTISYYIRTGAGGLPSLYRLEKDDPPLEGDEEIIEGAESMAVLYGEDTDADLSANSYLPADQIGDWARVVSVRLSLLLRTVEDNLLEAAETFSFNGQIFPASRYLRRALTTTIAIRNRLAN